MHRLAAQHVCYLARRFSFDRVVLSPFKTLETYYVNPILNKFRKFNLNSVTVKLRPFKNGGSKHSRKVSLRNAHSDQSKSEGSGQAPDPKSKLLIWIFCTATVAVGILAGYFIIRSESTLTTYDVFIRLLERGEVKEIIIPPESKMAYIKLHQRPGSATMIILPLPVPSDQFEKNIRSLESKWNIPSGDCIPINSHDSYVYEPLKLSPIKLILSSLILSTLMTVLTLYILVKRGHLPESIKQSIEKQIKMMQSKTVQTNDSKPIDNSDLSSKIDSASKSPSSSSSSDHDRSTGFDSDRFMGGAPFTWDPFSGLNSIKPVTTNIKFKDVAGLHASKQEVMEFVYYLRDPQKYQALGAKLPKGALLLGPPGTGKTLLVKALANEAGVPFFSMAGSEFVEVIGGLGAARMRQLFRAARQNPPSIIFIDELDSLGRRRSSSESGGGKGFSGGGGGTSEMEQTLNQLLVEMDGMDTAVGTIVFGATNRVDLLDRALLRAGRFDRHIFIDLPNLAERKELFTMYIAKYHLTSNLLQDELVDRLSSWTPGMSGADIARLCNEAALVAARRDDSSDGVTKADYEIAFERILAGSAKRSNPLSPSERYTAAVQEAGRALVAWLLPRTGLLPVKISIIPRTVSDPEMTSTLGFTHLIPEEKHLFTTDELADRIAVLLGGRAAEQIILKAVSDASQRQLREANKLALKQVREWGMSKLIGHLSFQTETSGGEFGVKPFSQKTQNIMELEAQKLVSAAFTRCVEILKTNQDKLQLLIDSLLKKEVLNYDELVQLLGSEYKSTIKPRL